jgi:hypothetical protein
MHHANTCIMRTHASCKHTHHANTCIMQTHASCKHMHHANTCIMQTHASCKHMHHANTCIMQTHASCKHMHHANTRIMQTHASRIECSTALATHSLVPTHRDLREIDSEPKPKPKPEPHQPELAKRATSKMQGIKMLGFGETCVSMTSCGCILSCASFVV